MDLVDIKTTHLSSARAMGMVDIGRLSHQSAGAGYELVAHVGVETQATIHEHCTSIICVEAQSFITTENWGEWVGRVETVHLGGRVCQAIGWLEVGMRRWDLHTVVDIRQDKSRHFELDFRDFVSEVTEINGIECRGSID